MHAFHMQCSYACIYHVCIHAGMNKSGRWSHLLLHDATADYSSVTRVSCNQTKACSGRLPWHGGERISLSCCYRERTECRNNPVCNRWRGYIDSVHLLIFLFSFSYSMLLFFAMITNVMIMSMKAVMIIEWNMSLMIINTMIMMIINYKLLSLKESSLATVCNER